MNPLERVRKTILERQMIPTEGGIVIVGYSGGADSTALLHILTQLQSELMIRVHAAHLHHGMRPEADADVAVCRGVCESLGVPFHWERADVPALAKAEGITLEEAGRKARYAFLERLADSLGAVAIATAHTRTDQIETILINLLRGTGPRGLRGIPYQRGRIIRPLLDVSRAETHAYCEAHGLPTVFDRTNVDPRQLRYRVRSQLVPLLQQLAPAFERHLLRLADIVENEEGWWDYYLREHFGNYLQRGARLPAEMFQRQHPAVQRRLLRAWIQAHVDPLSMPPYEILEAIRRALVNGRSTSWEISSEWRLLTDPHGATMHPTSREEAPEYEYPLYPDTPVLIPQAGVWLEATEEAWSAAEAIPPPCCELGVQEVVLDADALQGQLRVRNWRLGDRFQPLGMAHPKKVSRIFIDRKVPTEERRRLPLLCDEAGVVWIPDYTIAHRVRVTPQTKRIMRVRLMRNAPAFDSSDHAE